MGRKVTVSLGAICNTEERDTIHQAVAIQLSVGDVWIPKEPLVCGDPAGGKTSQQVADIASKVQGEVKKAADNGSDVKSLTPVTEANTTMGRIFSFSFETDAEEIDFGLTGIDEEGKGKERVAKTQLGMQVTVGEGPAELLVKEHSAARVFHAHEVGGWFRVGSGRKPAPPGEIPANRKKRLKKGEGGSFGDKLATVLMTGQRVQIAESPASAFWGSPTGMSSCDVMLLAQGFMPPDVGALLAPFFVTWPEAMTSGNRALVENGLYHWNAITSSEFALEEEFDDGSYAVAARISDAPPLRPAPVRVPTMQEVRIID